MNSFRILRGNGTLQFRTSAGIPLIGFSEFGREGSLKVFCLYFLHPFVHMRSAWPERESDFCFIIFLNADTVVLLLSLTLWQFFTSSNDSIRAVCDCLPVFQLLQVYMLESVFGWDLHFSRFSPSPNYTASCLGFSQREWCWRHLCGMVRRSCQ